MLTWNVHSDVARLEELVGPWRALLHRSSNAEPVLAPVWARAWWRQFGASDRRQLCAVTVDDDGRLIGLALLSRRTILHRRMIPVRRLELLMTGESEEDEICSDYVGVLAEKGREPEVARILARLLSEGALGGWDELLMVRMSAQDPLVPALQQALEAAGTATTLGECGGCPYITLPASWEAYLKALDSSRRYVVTRSLRELEKWVGKGGFELRRAATKDELAQATEILYRLHGERWERRRRSGVFGSNRFTAFHEEVMAELLGGCDGTLDLLTLTAGGQPICSIYNIVYADKVYFYQSGRLLDVPKAVKPGIAAHALAIQRAIQLGYREYDFLNGVSQYKSQLALATRPLVALRAVLPRWRPRLVSLACTTLEGAAAGLRRLPHKLHRAEGPPTPGPSDAGP